MLYTGEYLQVGSHGGKEKIGLIMSYQGRGCWM